MPRPPDEYNRKKISNAKISIIMGKVTIEKWMFMVIYFSRSSTN